MLRQQIVGPIVFVAVLSKSEEIFLGILVVLPVHAHVERRAAEAIERQARRQSRIAACAVGGDGVELDAVRAVRIGGRANPPEIAHETVAETRPGAGRKAPAREMEPMPALKDERQRPRAVVVPVQRTLDFRSLAAASVPFAFCSRSAASSAARDSGVC